LIIFDSRLDLGLFFAILFFLALLRTDGIFDRLHCIPVYYYIGKTIFLDDNLYRALGDFLLAFAIS